MCVSQVVDLPSTVKVEIYPIELFLCLHSNMENVVTLQFSRTDNICECACALLQCCELHNHCGPVCVFRHHPEGHVRSLCGAGGF